MFMDISVNIAIEIQIWWPQQGKIVKANLNWFRSHEY
jgi:hypothetical protein